MVGFSKSRLRRMADLLTGSVQRGEVGEVVALVSRDGETHVETAGGAEPDTIFRIASMSKPVAAVAALILVEECVLRLDDPVDEYLPELAARRVLTRLDGPLDDTVPAERPITLRDLLTFQLGIGFGHGMFGPPGSVPFMDALNELRGGMPRPAEVVEPDEWMRQLGSLPLACQPGTRWLYNTGSDILGVLIARVTGQPFGDFLHERIFAPLGMTDTGFWVPADARPAAAAVHQGRRRGAGRLRPAGRAVGRSPGVPVRRRRAGLHRPRLRRLRVDAARRRQLPGGQDPVPACGLADDVGPAAGRGEGGVRARAGRLRRHGLGVRGVGGDPPDAHLPLGRDLRLERRARHGLG